VAGKDEMIFEVEGGNVRLTHPNKLMFPRQGWTKADLARHYLACAEGALRGVEGRPTVLKRWPRGAEAEPFFQKRAPKPGRSAKTADGGQAREPAREFATIRFPSGRSADLLVPRHEADLLWMVQLNCIDFNPWPVRVTDLDRPDELRVDLDPSEGVGFAEVRETALACREVLAERGLVAWPKTSGSRGIHLLVRIEPAWEFPEVRRAALALAREVERKHPGLATSAWWKEERHGVFVDYNQNARDRTVASAYSVRQTGLVSAPLRWEEVPAVEPADFPMQGFAERYADVGDLTEGMNQAAGRLDGLLELYEEQAQSGKEDAPWPPHFPKQPGEPPRVQPSKRRKR